MTEYKMTYDLHTHTTYSHGKGTIRENVLVARGKGLKGIGITDHGRGHLFYGINPDFLKSMRREVELLNNEFDDIDVYLGVEANIWTKGSGLDVYKEELEYCHFINAGYHYGLQHCHCIPNYINTHGFGWIKGWSNNLKVKNTEMIVSALWNNDIKLLTHPGDKGKVDMLEIAKVCAETDTLMEISCHHKNLTIDEIKICEPTGVNFLISSDAHMPETVGDYQEGLIRAFAAGLDVERILNIEKI